MATPIGTLGTIPTLTVGNRVFTDLSTLINLGAYLRTSGQGSTLRRPGATAGYQVTSGKTYTISAVKILAVSGTAANIYFAYADNDIGTDSATALTNPIYMFGSTSGVVAAPASVGAVLEFNTLFAVAAQKYVQANVGATSTHFVQVFGYEA